MGLQNLFCYKCIQNICQKHSKFVKFDFKKRSLECNYISLVLKFVYWYGLCNVQDNQILSRTFELNTFNATNEVIYCVNYVGHIKLRNKSLSPSNNDTYCLGRQLYNILFKVLNNYECRILSSGKRKEIFRNDLVWNSVPFSNVKLSHKP